MTQHMDDRVVVDSSSTGSAGVPKYDRLESDRPPTANGFVVDLRTGQPLVYPQARSATQLACKRVMDVVGASLALVLFSPIFILTGLLVAITSRGPVFFRQVRVGEQGTEFVVLKFRSMYADAETKRVDLLAFNEHESGPIFKIRDDPRITPVGRVIRKSSIDELPQLFHVLSGKMSLVGPRPPLPEEVDTYGPRELTRLMVRPGLTCIWQVSGRSEIPFDTWMEMDIQYIQNWSLWLDVKLLAKTVWVVITCRGAY
jgi:exopolysaccharide biosynthesis polyprenyl glycosylphosphotransferase